MNFLIFEVARLLAWPGYLPITLTFLITSLWVLDLRRIGRIALLDNRPIS